MTNSSTASLNGNSIASRVRKPSGQITFIGACIFGRTGSGKTTLLGTMPGKGLVIDIPQVEGGTRVLEDKRDRIDVLPVVRWDELEETYQLLAANVAVPGTEFTGDYRWVALDSATAASELARRKAIKERPEGIAADPHALSQQDWGRIGQLMGEMFFKFRTLRMHVLFTAQERSRTDDYGTQLMPDISPAAFSQMSPSLDLLGRLFVREVPDSNGNYVWQRQLDVGPSASAPVKVRSVPSRPFPPVLVEPNLGDIFGYMIGKRGAPRAAAEEDVIML